MSAQIQEQTTEQPTAITEVNTAVAEFDRVAAGIGALKQQYGGVVFDVTTTAGMKAACEARAAIRAPRYEVEKVRKAVKAPLLKLGKDIDARAAQITADLLAIEEPVHQQITTEEARKEEERKRKAEAERARVQAIHDDIEQDLRMVPVAVVGRSAADLDRVIQDVVAIEITAHRFAEFTALASAAKASSLGKLREMHTRQLAYEAEQQRVAEERAELARQRAAQEEANRLERERIAAEEAAARAKRDAEAAAAKAERERIAAEEAAARAVRDAQESQARRQREAEEAAAAAERQRQIDEQMSKLRAERENNERIAREQREAAEAEHARIAAENARQAEELRRQQVELDRQRQEQQAARAELERHQQQIAATQQPEPAAPVEGPQAQDAAVVEPEAAPVAAKDFTPGRIELVALVANEYGTSQAKAEAWLVAEFSKP